MDHRRPAVRTSAGRVAGLQIRDQSTLLLGRKGLTSLDCHALADTRSEPLLDLILQRRLILFEILDNRPDGGQWIPIREQAWNSPDLECIGSELIDREA